MASGRPMLSTDESPCGAGVPPAGPAGGIPFLCHSDRASAATERRNLWGRRKIRNPKSEINKPEGGTKRQGGKR